MIRFGFPARRASEDAARLEARRLRLRAALALADDVAISVNEISCADPTCPVLETVVLIMAPGERTRAIKLHGSVDDLSEEALAEALRSAPQG
jgi:hypothetical protein